MNDRSRHLVVSLFLLVAVAGAFAAAPVLAASDAFQDAIAADEPILWFQLNETSGFAINHGSLGPDYNADYLGTPIRGQLTESGDRGVRFDSSDDYLQTHAISPDSLNGNPTFSAEALYYVVPDGGAANYAPFLHWGGLGGDTSMKSAYFSFHFNDSEKLYAGFYNGGLRTVGTFPRGVWRHVVWVRQGGGAANAGSTLYVDGVSVALESDPVLPFNSSTPSILGTEFRMDRARDLERWFTGDLDEVALYDRALTQEEVLAHYQALAPCDGDEACVDYDGGCRTCGHPASISEGPLASDALAVLRKAVGSRGCNLCICDVDESGAVVATDALLTLKKAVGQAVTLSCPEG